MVTAYLKDITLQNALKMFHGEEAQLSHLCGVGASILVHTRGSRKLVAAAWEGKVCGYIKEIRSYRVCDSPRRGDQEYHLH